MFEQHWIRWSLTEHKDGTLLLPAPSSFFLAVTSLYTFYWDKSCRTVNAVSVRHRLGHAAKALYECPVTAVTKCHKLGGLEQQKRILSQFCRPAQLQMLEAWFLMVVLWKDLSCTCFLASGGYRSSLAFLVGTSAQSLPLPSCSILLCVCLSRFPSSTWTSAIGLQSGQRGIGNG